MDRWVVDAEFLVLAMLLFSASTCITTWYIIKALDEVLKTLTILHERVKAMDRDSHSMLLDLTMRANKEMKEAKFLK